MVSSRSANLEALRVGPSRRDFAMPSAISAIVIADKNRSLECESIHATSSACRVDAVGGPAERRSYRRDNASQPRVAYRRRVAIRQITRLEGGRHQKSAERRDTGEPLPICKAKNN